MIRRIRSLLRDARGVMAIETAIIAPVLALMAIGIFETGTMVSRQQELQSAASEAESIILATAASATPPNSATVESIIEASLGLGPEQVTLQPRFRCDTGALTADGTTCPTGSQPYIYVLVQITDRYTPVWAGFGVGEPFDYNISRTVQVR